MKYKAIPLKKLMNIINIYTIHYFEYKSDFHFPGESHDFWKFQYVDQGSCKIISDKTTHILYDQEIIFHKPNEFHNISAYNNTAPILVVVSFSCNDEIMDFFMNKRFKLNDEEKLILGKILKEAKRALSSPLNDPYIKEMKLKQDVDSVSQALIYIYLELFLLKIYKRNSSLEANTAKDNTEVISHSCSSSKEIINYLKKNLHTNLTISKICDDNYITKSKLEQIFNKTFNCGVIYYFTQLKINKAKELIRKGNCSFTEIAEVLGYSSIHYFSKQFKQYTSMSPSEYSKSIKALSEENI